MMKRIIYMIVVEGGMHILFMIQGKYYPAKQSLKCFVNLPARLFL